MKNINNMGIVYWQFNNNWPSASWSTLDYSGNWKVSHNMVKRIFQDVLITTYVDDNNFLNVYVVNDLRKSFAEARILLQVYLYDQITSEPVLEISDLKDVKAETAELVKMISYKELFANDLETKSFVRILMHDDGG